MRVSWMTSSMTAPSTVHYGTTSRQYNAIASGVKKSYSYFLYKSGQMHHVVVGPLLDNTTYYYMCGGSGHEFKFTTPPPAGPDVPIKFAVVGKLFWNLLWPLQYWTAVIEVALEMRRKDHQVCYETNLGYCWQRDWALVKNVVIPMFIFECLLNIVGQIDDGCFSSLLLLHRWFGSNRMDKINIGAHREIKLQCSFICWWLVLCWLLSTIVGLLWQTSYAIC